MKKIIKGILVLLLCVGVVGCGGEKEVTFKATTENDTVFVGDTFDVNVFFEPEDTMHNYEFDVNYSVMELEYYSEDNSFKALREGEAEIQFYAISKKNRKRINANKIKIKIETEAKIVSISATYTGDTENGTTINEYSPIVVMAKKDDGTEEEIKGWVLSNSGQLTAGQTTIFNIAYKGLSCELPITCTTPTEGDYKAQCQSIAYEELARNGDNHKGEKIKFTGKIIQVNDISGGKGAQMRIATKGNYDNVILLGYAYKEGQGRYLEGDKVTVYGECNGLYTYESVTGANITVPSCTAEYIDIN